MPLPALYGVLTVLFAGLAAVWFWHARRNAADVQRIHYLMSLLVVTKTATLLVEALMYHFIALTGHSTGWNVVFYILNILRGCLVIVVIALIGAGYSLIKPFLSAREKKVIMIIVPLQVSARARAREGGGGAAAARPRPRRDRASPATRTHARPPPPRARHLRAPRRSSTTSPSSSWTKWTREAWRTARGGRCCTLRTCLRRRRCSSPSCGPSATCARRRRRTAATKRPRTRSSA
jgi:hypothetical protein